MIESDITCLATLGCGAAVPTISGTITIPSGYLT